MGGVGVGGGLTVHASPWFEQPVQDLQLLAWLRRLAEHVAQDDPIERAVGTPTLTHPVREKAPDDLKRWHPARGLAASDGLGNERVVPGPDERMAVFVRLQSDVRGHAGTVLDRVRNVRPAARTKIEHLSWTRVDRGLARWAHRSQKNPQKKRSAAGGGGLYFVSAGR